MLSGFLFRQYAVKFTISKITYYHLKWPGIIENSFGKRKNHVHSFYQTLILVFIKKEGQNYLYDMD